MRISTQRQVFAAVACIRDVTGNIFLQRRHDLTIPDAHGRWEFPGGKVEYGETPEAALKRECEEEMGCEIKVLDRIPCIWSKLWEKNNHTTFHAIIACYECRIVQGIIEPNNEEVAEVRWCTKKEVANLDTLPGVMEVINVLD